MKHVHVYIFYSRKDTNSVKNMIIFITSMCAPLRARPQALPCPFVGKYGTDYKKFIGEYCGKQA